MQDVQPILRAVLNDLPSTEEYNKYRQNLENVVKQISVKSSQSCIEKHINDLALLLGVIKDYKKPGASAEAAIIWKLFLKHGQEQYLKKQWFSLTKQDLIKLKKNIRKLDKSDDRLKVFTEAC